MASIKFDTIKIISINVTNLLAISAYDFGDLKVYFPLLQLALLPGDVLAILLSSPHLEEEGGRYQEAFLEVEVQQN